MWANIGAKKIPAFLRVKMWLGLESESDNFQRGLKDAEVAVFAETVRAVFVTFRRGQCSLYLKARLHAL